MTNSLTGVNGVTVALSGSQSGSTVTNSVGNYSFSVPHGGNYTLTPSHPNFTFGPSNTNLTNVTSTQTANFAAFFSLALILDESGPVAALDSVLLTRDPFPVINNNLLNQGLDRNTRVTIFILEFSTWTRRTTVVGGDQSGGQQQSVVRHPGGRRETGD